MAKRMSKAEKAEGAKLVAQAREQGIAAFRRGCERRYVADAHFTLPAWTSPHSVPVGMAWYAGWDSACSAQLAQDLEQERKWQ